MASPNVELVKAGYAALQHAYRTGDLDPLRTHFEAAVDGGFLVKAEGEVFTEGEWHGPEGLLAFVANQMEALDAMWIRPEEFIEVDDETIVIPVTFGGRARHTEIDVELAPIHLYKLRHGRALSLRIFNDRAAALAAAGVTAK